MELTEVAVYRRRVGASLERVWENVLDWEHLPWLHDSSFASIECLHAGPSGWRAKVELNSGEGTVPAEIDLRVERDRNRYVTATVAGVGAGTEIWTDLSPFAEHETDITVRFMVPGIEESRVERVGGYYTELYTRLWDEDESMMQHREEILSRMSAGRGDTERVDLGSIDDVLAKLPFVVDIDGRPYRVLSVDGQVMVHSAVCPHALGPLENAEVDDGRIRCPWHGYEFDLRSGRSCDGRNLSLGPRPTIAVENGRVALVKS